MYVCGIGGCFEKHNIQDTPAFKGACLQKVISAFRVEVNMCLAGVFCICAWGKPRMLRACIGLRLLHICKVDADSLVSTVVMCLF